VPISLIDEKAGRLRLTDLVDIAEFAELAGVQPRTIHSYRHPANRREGGTTTLYNVPEPVAHIGQTPVWTRKQVDAWIKSRPGQGARVDLRA